MHSFIVFFLAAFSLFKISAAELKNVPSSYQGRFLPADSYANSWLYEIYHKETLTKQDRHRFYKNPESAIDFVWKLHFFGHEPWDDAPLFWIQQATLKMILQLNPKELRFSYNSLIDAMYHNKETSLTLIKKMILYHYLKSFQDPSNRAKRTKLELPQLASGLWLNLQQDKLIVLAAPNFVPWNHLAPGMTIAEDINTLSFTSEERLVEEAQSLFAALLQFSNLQGVNFPAEKKFEESYQKLTEEGISPKEIALALETQYPFAGRALQSGALLKTLPGKLEAGQWFSLHALHSKVYNPTTHQLELAQNFSLYSNELFEDIRRAYFQLENAVFNGNPSAIESYSDELAEKLLLGYSTIAKTSYKEAFGKKLLYPSSSQLVAEGFYVRYPLIAICVAVYMLALGMFLLKVSLQKPGLEKLAMATFLLAFVCHSLILFLRVYILGRPPVSNMFETVLYVPWIAAFVGLLFYSIYKSLIVIVAASIISITLLLMPQIAQLNDKFENVQAVLDSQYWLVIHVLMVVGSYGVFFLCGILGHIYLIAIAFYGKKRSSLDFLAKSILQTMQLGVALLLPGTLLGGVWAAESWGRFWDWDPKESWAFISICTYLIGIHAHRFHKIGDIGLAFGAVFGLLAITFTWYGVNYILGTGLHSYGFGVGGSLFYYGYLVAEVFFLVCVAVLIKSKKQLSSSY